MASFGDFYRGRTVLVTGHTGFKGAWLSLWLSQLGAKVVGFATDPPTRPSLFDSLALASALSADLRGDVRDAQKVRAAINEYRPQIVFHLAAQPIVRRSYRDPAETFEINVMGTVNVLEAARQADSVQTALIVSSDKCYENLGWEWPYRETDHLGGHDPYSASKACTELVAAVYRSEQFRNSYAPASPLIVASARAGNVIGGGDWAADRIVPDIVRAITTGQNVTVRYPRAVRPWQHVLEPLSGYLQVAAAATADPARFAQAWNFGPPPEGRGHTVVEVIDGILRRWPDTASRMVVEPAPVIAESRNLQLDASKAAWHLNWHPLWNFEQTLDRLAAWYRKYYRSPQPGAMREFSLDEIEQYTRAAATQGVGWAAPTPSPARANAG